MEGWAWPHTLLVTAIAPARPTLTLTTWSKTSPGMSEMSRKVAPAAQQCAAVAVRRVGDRWAWGPGGHVCVRVQQQQQLSEESN